MSSLPTALSPVNMTTTIRGVVLPTWLACALGLASVLGALSFLLGMFLLRDVLYQVEKSNQEVAKEIRIQQIHTQDIENVLIRANLATRRDFAAWPESTESKTNNQQ